MDCLGGEANKYRSICLYVDGLLGVTLTDEERSGKVDTGGGEGWSRSRSE